MKRIQNGRLMLSCVLVSSILGMLSACTQQAKPEPAHSSLSPNAAGLTQNSPPKETKSSNASSAEGFAYIDVRALPKEAQTVIGQIKARASFPYQQDGQVFGNRERILPAQPRGYYHEYTVPTPGANNRGARRIVAGGGSTGDVATGGEYYYTADHYRSFMRVKE
ncbi:ribonuclease domain-containing protein [Hydromonas duriensis]|nr:ribonuclease domain-containing protein [Hydromonas duriensis]